MRSAEERDHPFTLVDVYRAVGLFHLRRGAIGRGLALLERGMAVVQERRLDLWQTSFAAALGHACTLAGDGPRAVRLCQEAVDRSESSGIVAGRSLRKAWLAAALFAVGQVERARQLADEAHDCAVRSGERASEAGLLHLKSRILAGDGPGRCDAALALLDQAISLARQLGMRPLLAHCHVTLGQVLGLAGAPSKAATHLQRAAGMFGRMRAPHWQRAAQRIASLQPGARARSGSP